MAPHLLMIHSNKAYFAAKLYLLFSTCSGMCNMKTCSLILLVCQSLLITARICSLFTLITNTYQRSLTCKPDLIAQQCLFSCGICVSCSTHSKIKKRESKQTNTQTKIASYHSTLNCLSLLITLRSCNIHIHLQAYH